MFEEIKKDELEPMVERLVLHAASKLKKLRWRGVLGGPAARGYTPEDIVSEAMVELEIGEKRHRNKAEYPSVEKQLKSIIDSIVSNAVQSHDNKTTGHTDERIMAVRAVQYSPEEDAAQNERASKIRDALETIALDDDDLLAAIDLMLKEGLMMPSDYVERLGLTLAKANGLKKKLRQAVIDAVAVLDGGSHA